MSEYRAAVQSKKNPFDYVTCSQGQVYIGHILVDECYDIQYAYREMKEPIYGYNSKYYDEILPGTVMVQGEFSINYKHDQYLQNMLKKISADSNGTTSTRLRNAKSSKETQEKLASGYKTSLSDIKALRDKIDEAKKKEIELKKKKYILSSQLDNALSSTEQAKLKADRDIENAKKANEDYYLSLSSEEAGKAQEAVVDINESTSAYLREKAAQEKNMDDADSSIIPYQMEVTDKQELIRENEITLNKYLTLLNKKGLTITQTTEYNNQIAAARTAISANKAALEIAIENLDRAKDEAEEKKKIALAAIQSSKERINTAIEPDGMLWWKTTTKQDAMQMQMNIRTAELAKEALTQSGNASIEQLAQANKDIQKEIDDLDIPSLEASLKTSLNDIEKTKKGVEDANNELVEAYIEANGNMEPSPARAEDGGIFDLYLYYNQTLHKIITGCSITGHSHAVGQGGEAIREYFTFIAKSIS